MLLKEEALKVSAALCLVAVLGIVVIGLADTRAKSFGEQQKNRLYLSDEARHFLNAEYLGLNGELAGCVDVRQYQDYSEANASLQTSYEVVGITGLVVSSGTNYVNHGYCDYGIVHSHKGGTCSFSLADIYSIKARFSHGEMFSLLMCGKDDFYYITRNDFEEKKII